MTVMRRVEVVWSGLTGLPGLSVFYSGSAVDVTTDLNTWFTALAGVFPTGLQWNIPGAGDTIEDTTGSLTGGWSTGSSFTISATGGTGGHAAGTGAFVRWGTNAIVGGRRLRGRTFLAPISGAFYDNAGTLTAGFLTAIGPATTTLAAAGKLLIWHRPPKGGASGSSSLVTSSFIPDQVTSLRSRRH